MASVSFSTLARQCTDMGLNQIWETWDLSPLPLVWVRGLPYGIQGSLLPHSAPITANKTAAQMKYHP